MAASAKALGGYVPVTFKKQRGGRVRESEVHGTVSGCHTAVACKWSREASEKTGPRERERREAGNARETAPASSSCPRINPGGACAECPLAELAQLGSEAAKAVAEGQVREAGEAGWRVPN